MHKTCAPILYFMRSVECDLIYFTVILTRAFGVTCAARFDDNLHCILQWGRR